MDTKITVCPDCGSTIIGVRDQEPFISNRVLKFRHDGTPCVVCKGRKGSGMPCKKEVEISKPRMLELMQVDVPAAA